VRDRNWGTVQPLISGFSVSHTATGFVVLFEARCESDDVDFSWEGKIEGSSDGTLAYTMEGRALKDFLRNRIGFCVLHPIHECAGKECSIERSDGTIENSRFPEFIAPHQPFEKIRAMTHAVVDDVQATVSFSGDTFETEDQRNWSDASYKTYCTPLVLPFPVQVSEGEVVRQKVTLSVSVSDKAGPKVQVGGDSKGVVRASWGTKCKLPRIGLGVASHGRRLETREIELLRRLKLDHLRLDLDPASGTWKKAFYKAVEEARQLGTLLHVALHLSELAESELAEVGRIAGELGPLIAVWLVFRKGEPFTQETWIKMARDQLQPVTPGARISTGTNAYFTELNRGFVPCESADLVSFSLNPQLHAFDDASMVETLETQPQMVLSCQRLAPGLPVTVSPITLRPRFNPDATSPEALDQPGEPPPEADPRQHALFSAVWLLGSVCGLSIPGTYAATYFETVGNLGVMQTATEPTRGVGPPSPGESVFPTYHVLADLAGFRDQEIWVLETESPPSVCGLVTEESPRRCSLANLTPYPMQLELDQGFGRVRVRTLDPSTLAEATQNEGRFRSNPGRILPEGKRFDLPPHSYIHVQEQL
ncbi:MAG TPA: hypothetical protein VMY18_03995, partial [Acidobacteriota bacterium]|nr:hypothetical protein [Acidobacteriota bacterium]